MPHGMRVKVVAAAAGAAMDAGSGENGATVAVLRAQPYAHFCDAGPTRQHQACRKRSSQRVASSAGEKKRAVTGTSHTLQLLPARSAGCSAHVPARRVGQAVGERRRGTAVAAPAKIEAMYEPERYGLSGGESIEVIQKD